MQPRKSTKPRIDQLTPGTRVLLGFSYGDEPATFVGITGQGDDRLATFDSDRGDGTSYRWSAYRAGGRWAYGSSCERLTLEAVYVPGGNLNAWTVDQLLGGAR